MNAHNEQHDPASPVVKQNLTTQPAAAQEAVAEVTDIIGRSGVEIHWLAGPAKIGDLLYAAPVAAAPANDLHAHLLHMLGAKDHEDAGLIIGELHAATMRNPAAPGIDLRSQMLRLAEKWERQAIEHGVRQFTGNDHLLFANELRAQIDASPKGGSEAWREGWALAYSGPSRPYGDDGELQDNSEYPYIDWRRDSAEVIRDKITERANRKLAMQAQAGDAEVKP